MSNRNGTSNSASTNHYRSHDPELLKIYFIDEAPPPVFSALGGLNQRMPDFMEMRPRMTVL
jgi:hypothetical protein